MAGEGPWKKLKKELEKEGPDSPKVADLQRQVVEGSLADLGLPGAPTNTLFPKIKKPKLVTAVPDEDETKGR